MRVGTGWKESALVSKGEKITAEASPWKLLLWTAVAGIVFGLIGFGEIAEDWLRVARNRLHWHNASGDIVLVKIDQRSLLDVGRWPWPRRQIGQMTDALTEAGAKRIFFDLTFDERTNPIDDQMFADSLRRSHRVYLAVRPRAGPDRESRSDSSTLPEFEKYATPGNISVHYNYQNAAWDLPYSLVVGGKPLSSYAAELAGRTGGPDSSFMVDYSIDPASIPTISASDLLHGKFDPKRVRGKDIVIGWTSEVLGDQYFIPGTGKMGGAYVHIIGAETLKSGTPVNLGWLPLFLVALALVAVAIRQRSVARQTLLLTCGAGILLFGPVPLEARLIYLNVTPGLFVVLVVSIVLFRRRVRSRGLVNPISNLPNLNALRLNRAGRNKALVAARILNYEEIVATLAPEKERQLIEQIVARLNVGSPRRVLYQGDSGIFAWFEEQQQFIGNHLEALYSLFRNPARVSGVSLDLSIAFGVEIGSGRSLANRLASALVAADEAAHDGLKWKYHDPESLENASWRLSMLSQLDEAIDRGEVWVAYQPKIDIATRRIIGAEALARWTHPEKGPIAASEFVAAAEQHNRIGKLTDFVLDKAVAAAAQIIKRSPDFNVAVNLSARLLTDKGFTLRLSALLARHGLAPNRLTLELTETAALVDNGEGLDMINRLRDLGVNISIDDYGTGQSTLDYLKKIPANEIKIDQSFVKGIVDNRSDRLMVQSTISLAHSLDRKVVAEGVEHSDILEVLVELDCDIAQGFAVGRPMSLEGLAKRVGSGRRRTAA
jgi:EAL domain-containing protein (putative c-di-GMP-specific phosphodiesterase class I)/CHASE2 domain-containing sensor protein